jgi:hypothetical protein
MSDDDGGFHFEDPDRLVRCTRCSARTGYANGDPECDACGPLKIRAADLAKNRPLLRGDPITAPQPPEV